MRRRLALAGSLLAVTALIGGGASAADVSSKRTVAVGDNFFDPDKISISAGTKVAFNWIGDKDHNVTKVSGPGGSFASTTTDSRGVNYEKKFKNTGKYKLVCTVHDKMKMKVKVK